MLRLWSFDITLDTDNKDVPLYQQLEEKVRELIATGTLKNGEAIPGSRELAKILNVSRKTVVTAMEHLVYGGWLENRERIGLFVADSRKLKHKDAALREKENPLPAEQPEETSPYLLQVNDGFPDTQLVPFTQFTRSYRQIFNRSARWQTLGYSSPRGNVKFRECLTQMLRRSRNLTVHPEELCVTRGSQQALYLTAHALLHPGETIVVGDTCYERAVEVFQNAGLKIVRVPVDEHGLVTDHLENLTDVSAIYVTPRYHYPTCVTMVPARRKQLAEWAIARQVLVIEDDFAAVYQYQGRRLLPLSVMLPKSNYVYISTFSKILAPAIRVGYVVSDNQLIGKIAHYRTLVDIQGDNITEHALEELISNGEIRRHLLRATRTYAERLDYISKQVTTLLPDSVKYTRPHGGLAIWLELPGTQWEKRLASRGIQAPIFKLPHGHEGIRIGFASMPPQSVDTLLRVIKEELMVMPSRTVI